VFGAELTEIPIIVLVVCMVRGEVRHHVHLGLSLSWVVGGSAQVNVRHGIHTFILQDSLSTGTFGKDYLADYKSGKVVQVKLIPTRIFRRIGIRYNVLLHYIKYNFAFV
jgi:hypothetical protein